MGFVSPCIDVLNTFNHAMQRRSLWRSTHEKNTSVVVFVVFGFVVCRVVARRRPSPSSSTSPSSSSSSVILAAVLAVVLVVLMLVIVVVIIFVVLLVLVVLVTSKATSRARIRVHVAEKLPLRNVHFGRSPITWTTVQWSW